jgi:DNA-binding NtrC family response regulator
MQTVLLVDDEPEKLRQMEVVANGENRRLLKASGKEEALQIVDVEHLDLVVTDIALRSKGLDTAGLDVLRAAKAKDSEVPVIIVSNYLAARDADEALDAGAFDIIDRASAPLDSRRLLRLKINQALKLRELQLGGALQHA